MWPPFLQAWSLSCCLVNFTVWPPLFAGLVKPGDEVEIMGLRDTIKTTVTGVEMFKKSLQQGQVGLVCLCVCMCVCMCVCVCVCACVCARV